MILSYWDVLYFHVRTVSFREGIKLKKKKGPGRKKPNLFSWDSSTSPTLFFGMGGHWNWCDIAFRHNSLEKREARFDRFLETAKI